MASALYAAPPTNPTNYFPGVVFTPAAFTNAGDTGLSVSNVYICLPLSAVTNSEYTAALVTNDPRPMVSSIVKAFRTSIAAKAATNQFDTYTISETIRYSDTGTSRTVLRAISEGQTITVTPGYGSN
jgi:hypothetical protein